jgi:hypothetical protein
MNCRIGLPATEIIHAIQTLEIEPQPRKMLEIQAGLSQEID